MDEAKKAMKKYMKSQVCRVRVGSCTEEIYQRCNDETQRPSTTVEELYKSSLVNGYRQLPLLTQFSLRVLHLVCDQQMDLNNEQHGPSECHDIRTYIRRCETCSKAKELVTKYRVKICLKTTWEKTLILLRKVNMMYMTCTQYFLLQMTLDYHRLN